MNIVEKQLHSPVAISEQLADELNAQGVHMAFVELRARLKHLVCDYGLFATLDAEHFYGSSDEAPAEFDTPQSAAAADERSPERNDDDA